MIETAMGILLALFIVCVVLPVCGIALFGLIGGFRNR